VTEARCGYCGARLRSGSVCRGHADLPACDPMAVLRFATPAWTSTPKPSTLHPTSASMASDVGAATVSAQLIRDEAKA